MTVQDFSVFFLFGFVYIVLAYGRGKRNYFAEVVTDFLIGMILGTFIAHYAPGVSNTVHGVVLSLIFGVGMVLRLVVSDCNKEEK